jgi:adenosine deaminase CECR1
LAQTSKIEVETDMDVALHLLLQFHQVLGYLIAFVIGPATLISWTNRPWHRRWAKVFLLGMLVLYLTGTPRTFLFQAPLSWGFVRNLTFNFFGVFQLIIGYRAIRLWSNPQGTLLTLDRLYFFTLVLLGLAMTAIGLSDWPMLLFGVIALIFAALDGQAVSRWSNRQMQLSRHLRYVFGSYYYLLTVISIVHAPAGHDTKWLWPAVWGILIWTLAYAARDYSRQQKSMLPWSIRGALTANLSLCLLIVVHGGQGLNAMLLAKSTPLEAKLQRQWQRFDVASETVRERASRNSPIYRPEWESLIHPGIQFQLSTSDLESLRKSQQTRIECSAKDSRQSSAIDLDRVRSAGRVREFCRDLPKGGMLHVHPNGTLKRPTVEKLLRLTNPQISAANLLSIRGIALTELRFLEQYSASSRFLDLSPVDQGRLIDLYFLPESSHAFARFDAIFGLVRLLKSDSHINAQEILFCDFFERSQSEKIYYVEFTYAFPVTQAALAELERIADVARQRFGITMRVNFAFHRGLSAADNLADYHRLTQLIAEHPTSVIVGIDLLGKEPGYPAFETGQLIFGAAISNRLHRTMHAAGIGEIRNLRDAILMGAERIGHGTKFFDSPVALEYAAQHRLPVEVNLVSNVRLGYADDFRSHPAVSLLRLGLRVSLSTDDEGMLGTSLSNEFAMCIEHTDICYAEVKQLIHHSIDTAFCSDSERESLRQRLDDELAEFESQWREHPPVPAKIAERPLMDAKER